MRSNSTHEISSVTLAYPLYSDFALDLEITFRLDEDQEIKLGLKGSTISSITSLIFKTTCPICSVERKGARSDVGCKDSPKSRIN